MSYSKKPTTPTEARKKDALSLAELIYDMFKEEEQRENSTIEVSDD